MGLKFETQRTLENEGITAAVAGWARAACPYEEGNETRLWWLYGWDNANSEREMLTDGTITFCSTSEHGPSFTVGIQEAMDSGLWKPRYFTAIPTSSGKTP